MWNTQVLASNSSFETQWILSMKSWEPTDTHAYNSLEKSQHCSVCALVDVVRESFLKKHEHHLCTQIPHNLSAECCKGSVYGMHSQILNSISLKYSIAFWKPLNICFPSCICAWDGMLGWYGSITYTSLLMTDMPTTIQWHKPTIQQ